MIAVKETSEIYQKVDNEVVQVQRDDAGRFSNRPAIELFR